MCVVACNGGQTPVLSRASVPAEATKVDSILPPGVALDRFLAGTGRPTEFTSGAATMMELVEDLGSALESGKPVSLVDLTVTREEYGSLYYPTSVYARKPYELSPDIAWMLNSEASGKGARRLMQRLGGRELDVLETTCRKTISEGANRLASDCEVAFRVDGGPPQNARLFQSIIERDGHLKFLSLASDY